MSNPTTERVTAAQVLDAVADVACLPLGISMPEWQRISSVFIAAARQIEQSPEPAGKNALRFLEDYAAMDHDDAEYKTAIDIAVQHLQNAIQHLQKGAA